MTVVFFPRSAAPAGVRRVGAMWLAVVAGVSASPVAGQSRQSGPMEDPRASIVAEVAATWGVAAGSVRVEVPSDAPTVVDSVSVTVGSGERWIVSFWTGGDVVRRFVRVGTVRAVSTAASDLPRGHTVTIEDVDASTQVAWGPPSGDAPSPSGWVTQRRLRAGEPLVEPAVRPPLLVHGGDEVEAILARNGVVLNIRAEALSSARSGDLVAVRMPSGRRMEGRVVGRGKIMLDSGVNR